MSLSQPSMRMLQIGAYKQRWPSLLALKKIFFLVDYIRPGKSAISFFYCTVIIITLHHTRTQ